MSDSDDEPQQNTTLPVYLRRLRLMDIPMLKACHQKMFQFEQPSHDSYRDAVLSSRWVSLAAVNPSRDQTVGFVVSVVGSGTDFATSEFDGSMGSGATAAIPPLVSDDPQSMQDEASMPQYVQQGLDQLGLGPDERAVNVCLLGVLPGFRRRGVARQILVQVVNAARSAGARMVFLHVMASNTPALDFYRQEGFEEVTRIPDYYQLLHTAASASTASASTPGPSASIPADATSSQSTAPEALKSTPTTAGTTPNGPGLQQQGYQQQQQQQLLQLQQEGETQKEQGGMQGKKEPGFFAKLFGWDKTLAAGSGSSDSASSGKGLSSSTGDASLRNDENASEQLPPPTTEAVLLRLHVQLPESSAAGTSASVTAHTTSSSSSSSSSSGPSSKAASSMLVTAGPPSHYPIGSPAYSAGSSDSALMALQDSSILALNSSHISWSELSGSPTPLVCNRSALVSSTSSSCTGSPAGLTNDSQEDDGMALPVWYTAQMQLAAALLECVLPAGLKIFSQSAVSDRKCGWGADATYACAPGRQPSQMALRDVCTAAQGTAAHAFATAAYPAAALDAAAAGMFAAQDKAATHQARRVHNSAHSQRHTQPARGVSAGRLAVSPHACSGISLQCRAALPIAAGRSPASVFAML